MASVGVSCQGGAGGEKGERIGMRETTPAPSLSTIYEDIYRKRLKAMNLTYVKLI